MKNPKKEIIAGIVRKERLRVLRRMNWPAGWGRNKATSVGSRAGSITPLWIFSTGSQKSRKGATYRAQVRVLYDAVTASTAAIMRSAFHIYLVCPSQDHTDAKRSEREEASLDLQRAQALAHG